MNYTGFWLYYPTFDRSFVSRLNSQKWFDAINKYAELSDDAAVDYEQYSATALIHISVDGYFDNQTILKQFECLFKLT